MDRWLGWPTAATSASAIQTCGSKFAQFRCCDAAVKKAVNCAGSASACRSWAPFPAPSAVNRAAHWYLKTPVPEALAVLVRTVPPGRLPFSGAREWDRSFQVICGTIASSRFVRAALPAARSRRRRR
jgi:hypothetical protein